MKKDSMTIEEGIALAVSVGMIGTLKTAVWKDFAERNKILNVPAFLKSLVKVSHGNLSVPSSYLSDKASTNKINSLNSKDKIKNAKKVEPIKNAKKVEPIKNAKKVEPIEKVKKVEPIEKVEFKSSLRSSTFSVEDDISFVPSEDSKFVSFGNFGLLKRLVQSNIFISVYITGMSGNGKSVSVLQACAKTKRDCIRVNIDGRTSEDALIGHFELINGSYVWNEGPVLTAMKRGAVLLLDEIDAGKPENLFCLQAALEGNAVFVKKRNEYVYPRKGFCVFATANTKGRGSSDGRYIGTNLQNEALLDRFSLTIEQDYPSATIEKKILTEYANEYKIDDVVFIDNLTNWAKLIRDAFLSGACDEVVSTRRLIDILKVYSITKNRRTAVELCISRFDNVTKMAFLEFLSTLLPDLREASSSENTTL